MIRKLSDTVKKKSAILVNAYLHILNIFAYFNYLSCMIRKKPYLGRTLASSQSDAERKSFMQQLIKNEIYQRATDTFRLIEVGSWAGSSAILWANAMKAANLKDGMLICVDPWQPYLSKEADLTSKIMQKVLIKDAIFKLFLHNINTSRLSDLVKIFKGASNDVLPCLKEHYFDLVYIDGSHYYKDVKQDIKNSSNLIKDGGILCGDDLELQVDEIDLQFAKDNLDKDNIIDIKTNKCFHPGVTLAVSEFFEKKVTCYKGFWVMRKAQNDWVEVHI